MPRGGLDAYADAAGARRAPPLHFFAQRAQSPTIGKYEKRASKPAESRTA